MLLFLRLPAPALLWAIIIVPVNLIELLLLGLLTANLEKYINRWSLLYGGTVGLFDTCGRDSEGVGLLKLNVFLDCG